MLSFSQPTRLERVTNFHRNQSIHSVSSGSVLTEKLIGVAAAAAAAALTDLFIFVILPVSCFHPM